ncbi:hypothetical protein ABFT23_18440 [Nocardioides sp. C4-1]|uniref:hypothetical protein n=1 Tax=Nocardioides sp. C4-1 TaxID=3151851 RepID=UPI003266A2A1
MPDASVSSPLPRGLLLAAVVVGVEGLVLLALAVAGLVDRVPGSVEVSISVAVFFAVYGAGLLFCSWGLTRLEGWTRGPVLITQLIVLGIAWNARENAALALGLAVVGIVTIVAMLRPASVAALLGER